jgi:hypothetical protein
MLNLVLKLAIVSGLLMVFVLRGNVEQRLAAASHLTGPLVETLQAKAVDRTETAAPAPASPSPGDTAAPGVVPETSQDLAATSFASEITRLSSQADGVDRLWETYKAKCGVHVDRQYDFGREWFAIWDRAGEPSAEAAGCGDGLARVRQAGEKLGRGILKARTMARQAGLDRATEIGMLRWHGLQWSQFEENQTRPRPSAPSAVVSTVSSEAPRSASPMGREP